MPKKIEARQSAIHGNGVFATEAIAKGERVIRYKGLLRTHAEVDAVYADEADTGHTFLFTLNDKYVIDANVEGNDARWINHSCDPNCEASWLEDGKKKRKDKIFIEAMRDIAAGRRADLQLRHRAARAAHRQAEEALGLPLRLQALHRHHAPAQAPRQETLTLLPEGSGMLGQARASP